MEGRMPEPDPHGIEPGWNGPLSVNYYLWPCGNRRNRIARAKRILFKLRFGNWSCPECGDPVPFQRRADAVYCRDACRKRVAHRRRKYWRSIAAAKP